MNTGSYGFVYVAESTGWVNPNTPKKPVCKIGISVDPTVRATGLQAPAPVHMVKVYPTLFSREQEAMIFSMLKRHRLHGEFFGVSASSAVAMIDNLLGEDGTLEQEKANLGSSDDNPYADRCVSWDAA